MGSAVYIVGAGLLSAVATTSPASFRDGRDWDTTPLDYQKVVMDFLEKSVSSRSPFTFWCGEGRGDKRSPACAVPYERDGVSWLFGICPVFSSDIPSVMALLPPPLPVAWANSWTSVNYASQRHELWRAWFQAVAGALNNSTNAPNSGVERAWQATLGRRVAYWLRIIEEDYSYSNP